MHQVEYRPEDSKEDVCYTSQVSTAPTYLPYAV